MPPKSPIYLDYAATTPVDRRVAECMAHYLGLDGDFGNPASVEHGFGRTAAAAVEAARTKVAALVGADPGQIIWTSGATESCNLAIKGACRNLRARGAHLVTAQTEHKAVLDPCRALEAEGFCATYLEPGPDGRIGAQAVAAALRPDTTLVSIMHVNNETGAVQDLETIGRTVRRRGVAFHVDAAQGAGKLPIDVDAMNIDLLSLSAHKVYGPKGVGALYLRDGALLGQQALIHGGGHERGLRSGTLPTHQIAGMGMAFDIAKGDLDRDRALVARLRDRLWNGLLRIGGCWLNGSLEHAAPGILNVGFDGVDGEDLLLELDDVALSTGAACSAFEQTPSHVLHAMGLSDEQVSASVRFSLGRFTTAEEIDYAVRRVDNALQGLRGSR